jgi:hypothetical protein
MADTRFSDASMLQGSDRPNLLMWCIYRGVVDSRLQENGGVILPAMLVYALIVLRSSRTTNAFPVNLVQMRTQI